MVLSVLWLVALSIVPSHAENIVEIPRRHTAELSHRDFDIDFLDGNTPLILEGATICPKATLSNISKSCIGKHPYSEEGGSSWAGLNQRDELVSVKQFVNNMNASGRAPRYLFDVNPFDYCPNVMRSVEWPSHFNTAFAGQFLDKCHFPVYSLYISERGFKSNLHCDSVHQAFIASMCEGSKRWLIVKNKEWAANIDTVGRDKDQRGLKFKGQLLFADLPKPYSTWGPKRKLRNANVTVYEGVLKPGEILLVPPSALHAAETLEHSLMAAMNDYTFAALNDIFKACKASKKCKEKGLAQLDTEEVEHYLEMRLTAERLRKERADAPRERASWLSLYGCAGKQYCKSLREKAEALGQDIKYTCSKNEVRAEL